mgnify:CR=1 FL=1
MQQTACPSLGFFFSYFIFPKKTRSDFESSVQILAVCSCSLSLSQHYMAQQHPALVPTHGRGLGAVRKVTMCALVLLLLPTWSCACTPCSDTHCCYRGHFAAAVGLCSAANICAGVSSCFQHEQQKLCV